MFEYNLEESFDKSIYILKKFGEVLVNEIGGKSIADIIPVLEKQRQISMMSSDNKEYLYNVELISTPNMVKLILDDSRIRVSFTITDHAYIQLYYGTTGSIYPLDEDTLNELKREILPDELEDLITLASNLSKNIQNPLQIIDVLLFT